LAALHASLGRGVSLSECFGRLPQRFGVSDLLRDFPREAGQTILQRFQPRDESIEHVEFTFDGASARQHGRTAAALASVELTQDLNRCREAWERLFRPGEGYAKVVWMNFLDGVRVGLADGGVVQVRPSGNAPDFRVYATASSMERAVELARQTLRILGELRRGVPTQSEPGRPTVEGMPHAGG
jgi:phosphomannomutase